MSDGSSAWGRLEWWPRNWPLRPPAGEAWTRQPLTYADTRPALIEAARKRAQSRRPSGNWFVLAASRDVRPERALAVTVADDEVAAWRDDDGQVVVGPGACPHLGAPLSQAVVDFGEPPLGAPVLPARPQSSQSVHAVATLIGVCEPEDIMANRLAPWHGAWFHPYFFSRLSVLAAPEAAVADRAEFTCPAPRTEVMRITEGEGSGSVGETHATPLGRGPDGRPRTAVVEAVVAHSSRPGFAQAGRTSPDLRPAIKRGAAPLWRDDLAYAERRYRLRSG